MYQCTRIGRIFVTRLETTALEDNPHILLGISQTRAIARENAFCLNIVPESCPSPSIEVRKAWLEMGPKIYANCDYVSHVFEGADLQRTLYRSIVRTLFLLCPFRKQIGMHESARAALEASPVPLRVSVDHVIAELVKRRFIAQSERPAA